MTLLLAASPIIQAQNAMPQPNLEQVNQMFFQQFDRNQDGKVTQKEFVAPRQEQFAYMDKNQDGMIEMAEVQAFTQEMVRRSQQQQ